MSKKARKKQDAKRSRRSRLSKKLAAYSVAASAGVFANERANAAVVHVDPADQLLFSGNTSIFLDYDGDSTNDVEFQYFNFAGSKQTARIVGTAGTNKVRIRYEGIKRVPKYPAGKMVDATHPLETAGFEGTGMGANDCCTGTWAASSFGYLSYFSYGGFNLAGSNNLKAPGGAGSVDDGAYSWHQTTTSFASLGPGYIPMQFDISGSIHYGWIQVEVYGQNDGFPNPDGAAVLIMDWAYEDVAGATILTGDVGSGGGGGAAPTPEPASLGLLALGAVGLAATRRRRRNRD